LKTKHEQATANAYLQPTIAAATATTSTNPAAIASPVAAATKIIVISHQATD
jgi:hypothetical protein